MSDRNLSRGDATFHSIDEAAQGSPVERNPPTADCDIEYVDYSLEWPAMPRVDPIEEEVREKVKKLHSDLKATHIRRNELLRKAASMRIPAPLPDLVDQLKGIEISMILATVLNCLACSNSDLGMKEAKKALELARNLNHQNLIARCYYWMGRIEFQQGNIPVAHEYFEAAMPCIEDDECAEGDFVEFWFKSTRPGINEEYRNRAVNDHSRRVINTYGATKLPTAFRSTLPAKRSYKEWREIILRPRPAQSSGAQQGPSTERSKQKDRLVPWIIPDVHNEPYETPFHLRRRFQFPPEAKWQPFQSHAPLLRNREFTFRCYPKGLSPRYRPTKIFRPHPLEIIYTQDAWSKLRRRSQGKTITMTWLANEMALYDKLVHKRLTETRKKYLEMTVPQQT
ncbi:uncharacterized protein N7477_005808 [Penicillium maclennaniae]|uniref:uncharacterized protein n=1 Tax=Penicillium maclennaniae TaxID=1343394 RepID=UPI002540D5CB|nr:uncharacterized protein N7477_005808 [Penicillium maclennaniae]KAJ5670445.1 hypothetical protein N7477_005808 [Penicillium maclennaniae]